MLSRMWQPSRAWRLFGLAALVALVAVVVAIPISAPAKPVPAKKTGSALWVRNPNLNKLPWQEWLGNYAMPGYAVSVVTSDRVLYEKGMGVRQLSFPGRFNPDTITAIASTTKTFAAATVLKLVDEGEVDLDAPITKYLPNFTMPNPALTFTVRDMLRHTTGLPTVPEVLQSVVQKPGELVEREKFNTAYNLAKPFSYANENFIFAGALVEAVTGMSWADYARKVLFKPLGMDRTRGNIDQYNHEWNIGVPHLPMRDGILTPVKFGGQMQPVTAGEWNLRREVGAPDSGGFSTAHDLGRWTQMYLGEGKANGRRILSKASIAALTQQTVLATPVLTTATGHKQSWELLEDELGLDYQYGLGMLTSGVGRYGGLEVLTHRGVERGTRSMILIFPEADLGIAVVQNGHYGNQELMSDGIAWSIADQFLAKEPLDWTEKYRQESNAIEAVPPVKPGNPAPPTLTASELVGDYTDNGLIGTIRVSLQGNQLRWSIGKETGNLIPWTGDSYRVLADWFTGADGLYGVQVGSFVKAPSGAITFTWSNRPYTKPAS